MSLWLISEVIFMCEVIFLIPIEAFVVSIGPHLSGSLLLPLTVQSSPLASVNFHFGLRGFKRTESIKHVKSGFVRECNVEHVHIRLSDTFNSVHHDSCILSQEITVEAHLFFNRGTEVTCEMCKLAAMSVLTNVRRRVVGLAESNFVAGSNVSLLVQVFSSVSEGALVSKLAVSFLPILAKLGLLLLLVGGLERQVVVMGFSSRG